MQRERSLAPDVTGKAIVFDKFEAKCFVHGYRKYMFNDRHIFNLLLDKYCTSENADFALNGIMTRAKEIVYRMTYPPLLIRLSLIMFSC